MTPTPLHKPVMPQEVIQLLNVATGSWYVDGTFGRGGHTRMILEQGGKVVAFDVDPEAIQYAQTAFAQYLQSGQLVMVKANFAHIKDQLPKNITVSGYLFDFGTSVDQLTSSQRGFSLHDDGPLDMRMDDTLQVTAQDLLNALSERELAMIFTRFGGEHQAKMIAKAIKKHQPPISSTGQLTKLIEKIKYFKGGKIHPATKVFQALRIAVNDELGSIEQLFNQLPSIIRPETRVVTIAFHEGEDRLAKQYLKEWEDQGLGQSLSKKPLTPTQEELDLNPRSRSAKVRGFIFNK